MARQSPKRKQVPHTADTEETQAIPPVPGSGAPASPPANPVLSSSFSAFTSTVLTGVPPAATALAVAQILAEARPAVAVLVANNLGRAENIAEEIPYFTRELVPGAPRPRIRALPPPALVETDANSVLGDTNFSANAFDTQCDLLAVLSALRHDAPAPASPLLIAASPPALSQPCPAPEDLQGRELVLRTGFDTGLRALVETLADFGYDNEALCESPGQFAVRGGLVDIYPLNATSPVRVDFFGDTVEAIRTFDPATQRSDAVLEHVAISASVGEQTAPPRDGAFVEHLPPGVLWIILEPSTLEKNATTGTALMLRDGDTLALITEFDDLLGTTAAAASSISRWEGCDLASAFPAEFNDRLGADRLSAEEALREKLLLALAQRQHDGALVKILGATEGAVARLRALVAEAKIRWKPLLPSPAALARTFAPEIGLATLSAGFILKKGCGPRPIVIATEHELFGRTRSRLPSIRQRRLPHKSRVEQLLDFNELADGDSLVHLQNGICLYRGINKIGTEEMISLEFADSVTTHLPLREAHLLSRYVGLRKAIPKLGKIGSNTWAKTRHAAETATIDLASDLLSLHATRHARPGIAFPRDAAQPWLLEFERSFPFRETPDQARAIEDTKRDMEKDAPMDRLICGDVGYGKTEIALRAAFKAVLAGYQVAILAPTTVLVQQHFNTFRERFAKYPLSVEMLSRFRKPAQRTRIIEQINTGQLDVVVGTHALLSNAVKFPKLGLLVIDEEHRFGVKQKEIIKRLKADVDILCMSATPIPRTLYLALQGARELSVIETAPRERLPIRTLVRSYDIKLVQEAIRYEIGRGGQVFYLHNRVETIAAVAARLHDLMPDIRFGVGHGKMNEAELEEIMTAFVAGAFDVLVCTTIIETGLDIPNCNTLILEGADRFGLAQLYQLRGRVGRFNRQAYAYLLLHRHTNLLDTARRRLSAIRQHNQLGAGLRIAMRDLELRGTGNLLGHEQSGHIAGVGFDLYCQLLRQSIARLKGQPLASAVRCDVRLDFVRLHGLGDEAAERKDNDTAPEFATDFDGGTNTTFPHGQRTPASSPAGRTHADTSEKPSAPPALTSGHSHGYRLLREEDLSTERITELSATLPASYISDIRLRIDIFRKLAMTATEAEVAEIARDMEDRFGKLPASVEAFVAISGIRILAESRGVVSVETDGMRLKCRLGRPAKDGSIYLKNGANFPHLTQKNPVKRLREIRAYLLRQPKMF